MEIIKPGRMFNFMKWRWHFIGASVSLLVLSIISFIYPGPKMGTDFKGGTEVELAFREPVTAGEVRHAVEKIGFESPEVVAVTDAGNPNHFLIRVQEVTVLGEKDKDVIRGRMCLPADDGTAPAGCQPASSPTEIKFSPGGDKITAR